MIARNDSKVEHKRVRHRVGSQRWAAKQLGVTHAHLNLVLHGKRISKSLTDRYHSLMADLEQEAGK